MYTINLGLTLTNLTSDEMKEVLKAFHQLKGSKLNNLTYHSTQVQYDEQKGSI